ncbi:hypothetical protein GF371_05025 [Candidatus Woesearchaeota archaeon]|nr:hypothetical protein [Candidatus Woesearchaeota archaeon]
MTKMRGMFNMRQLFLILILISIVLLAGCNVEKVSLEVENGNEPEKELAGMDKEIKALQDELEKSLTDEEVELIEAIEKRKEEVKKEEPAAEEEKETAEKEPVKETKEGQKEDKVDVSKLQKLEVLETELVKLKISAEDDDKDSIEYTFSRPLNQRGEWQTNYGDAGEYIITITATDGELTTKRDFVLVVNKKNEAPVIAHMSDVTAQEGETVRIEPSVSDVNNDELIVSISDPVGDDGIWETDHKSAGSYDITIKADDGESASEESLKLVVVDKNMPPLITGLQDITVKEGETVKIKPQIKDLDGDTVEVSISSPVGDDGEWETAYTDHGVYDIKITADDGKDKVEQNIKLTVTDVNRAPEILSIDLA